MMNPVIFTLLQTHASGLRTSLKRRAPSKQRRIPACVLSRFKQPSLLPKFHRRTPPKNHLSLHGASSLCRNLTLTPSPDSVPPGPRLATRASAPLGASLACSVLPLAKRLRLCLSCASADCLDDEVYCPRAQLHPQHFGNRRYARKNHKTPGESRFFVRKCKVICQSL